MRSHVTDSWCWILLISILFTSTPWDKLKPDRVKLFENPAEFAHYNADIESHTLNNLGIN
jgi:hypothetical protein